MLHGGHVSFPYLKSARIIALHCVEWLHLPLRRCVLKSPSESGNLVCAGCGKSTLMMSIYRIVEPCGGNVTIDGQDICQMGLFDLRSRLALVPQVGRLCIRA